MFWIRVSLARVRGQCLLTPVTLLGLDLLLLGYIDARLWGTLPVLAS